MLLGVTVAMYICTFTYWVAFLVTQFRTLSAIARHLSNDYWWLHGLADSRFLIPPSKCFPGSPFGGLPEYCTAVRTPSYAPTDGWDITQGDCIGTATLTFNVRGILNSGGHHG